jgi:hypothetical protein
VQTGVSVDADGKGAVSKTVKENHADAYGNSSKSVTEHSMDTNGSEKVKTYHQETTGN